MEVEQKHITTIRMHDAKGADVSLVREGPDYYLRLMSSNHVVNILLSHQEVRKLCQQFVQMDIQENGKAYAVTPSEPRSFFSSAPRSYYETVSSWFANTANEGYDKTNHRCHS